MEIELLEEPKLQFGNGIHVDPRQGILLHGPSDIENVRPNQIVLGLIGKSESIEKAVRWLEKYQFEVKAPKKKIELKNLFPSFPGFNVKNAFKCKIIYDDTYKRKINNSEFQNIIDTAKKIEEIVENAVTLYLKEIEFLAKNKNPDVILCLLDEKFTSIIYGNEDFQQQSEELDEEEESELIETIETNFRRLLKARSMESKIPIQIVRDRIYKAGRDIQDEATIGWNFFTALYYKASGTPWSILRKENKQVSCFAGITFYKSRDKKTTQTSITQIFNEHGQGVILRGSEIRKRKEDLEPHMTKTQAYDLLKSALEEYHDAMKISPQRLVIHKSSNYTSAEIQGLKAAAEEFRINSLDLVTVMTTKLRLYNEGIYPPKRGTVLSLSDKNYLLYTRGYVDHYGTYPGKYIPSPLEIRLFHHDESPIQICKEILTLTKMNWNNTQFDKRLPITLDCSRKVGEILKYIPADKKPQIRYSFYM